MQSTVDTTCLCGAVKVSAITSSNAVVACHCTQCQRWTGGGPLFTVRVQNVSFEPSSAIEVYRASSHGERGFCKHCGTTLYWTMRDEPPRYLPVGLLESQVGLTVREEIFIDNRPSWLSAFEGATQSTEAEQLALLDDYLQSKESQ